MMKHKKTKAKKAKVYKLKGKKGIAKGKKLAKRAGEKGVPVRTYATRRITEEDVLSERVAKSLQNYKDGNTRAFTSIDEVWQAAESG